MDWNLLCQRDFKKDGQKEDYISYYQQELIIKKIKEKKNLFITGSAGSGKSYMIRKIKELFPTFSLTSSTGVSAFLIKGRTFHSFFGVGTGVQEKEKLYYKVIKNHKRVISQVKTIIIDEVSMLSPKLFEKVDYICQRIRNNKQAFGGIQLILVGDFFQLPPVKEDQFLFETQTWNNLNLISIHFKKIYRQADPFYASLLSRIRLGQHTKQDILSMRTRIRSEPPNLPYIFCKKIEVQNLNNQMLNNLNEPWLEFPAKVSYQFLSRETPELRYQMEEKIKDIIRDIPFDDKLFIKKGSRVMLKVNLDVEVGLVNGAMGTLVETEPALIVKFDNGVETTVGYYQFIHEEEDYIVSVSVVPLIIAYAFTVHSVQGCTLEHAKIDISSCFDFGQAYVALSRVKNWDGLYLEGFPPHKIKTNSKVIEFYKSL